MFDLKFQAIKKASIYACRVKYRFNSLYPFQNEQKVCRLLPFKREDKAVSYNVQPPSYPRKSGSF